MTSVSALEMTVSVESARPGRDRLDGPPHDLDRDERSDRVVDDDDVVVGGGQVVEAVARALVAGRARRPRPRSGRPGPRCGQERLGLGQPVGMRHDDEPVDPGRR